MLAKCGMPIVAAVAGKVRVVDYQASGAGNYVVISGKSGDYDYVYMHLLSNVLVEVRRSRRHRAAHRHGRIDRRFLGLPSSLRDVGGARLVPRQSLVNPTPFLKRWDRASRPRPPIRGGVIG